MQIVTDMGAHAPYVWPAYAAFVVLFAGLIWWAATSNTRTRDRLETLEKSRKSPEISS